MKQLNYLNSKTSIRKLVLSGIVLASGIVGTAQAASTLASGLVYGGPNQHQVACSVVNTGITPIHFVTKELIGEFRSSLILNFDGCGSSLAGKAICNFQASTDNQCTAPNQATACKVVIAEAKTNVHGTVFSLDRFGTGSFPLGQTDLR